MDCPQGCGGWLVITSSRRAGLYVVRYPRCWKCGYRAPREIVASSTIKRRRKRSS